MNESSSSSKLSPQMSVTNQGYGLYNLSSTSSSSKQLSPPIPLTVGGGNTSDDTFQTSPGKDEILTDKSRTFPVKNLQLQKTIFLVKDGSVVVISLLGQVFTAMLYPLLFFAGIAFFILWLLLGMLLVYCRVFGFRCVWDFWFYVWTGGHKYRLSLVFRVRRLILYTISYRRLFFFILLF